jgi:hypothetical protein
LGPIGSGYTQRSIDHMRKTRSAHCGEQEIDIDPYLVVANGEPQCLNNVQGANFLGNSFIGTSKGQLSTGYSTEHPHNRMVLPALQKLKGQWFTRNVGVTFHIFRSSNSQRLFVSAREW